jgi:beta-glucosidase/6-phospho-beta-glucosidase/beta-galactosidase
MLFRMTTPGYRSFIMGGFECSTHKDFRNRRLDLISSTRHEEFVLQDYLRCIGHGIHTVRDGVRWHLIEHAPFEYDFTSLLSQVNAAKSAGVEVIWDYFHYGYPNDLDIFSGDFSARFASFAAATTRFLAKHSGGPLNICPVNEISFFSWIAGDKGLFYPAARGRADELKGRLIEASVAAVGAIRKAAPDSRLMFTEPAIHVVPQNTSPHARRAAEEYRRSQFQALDLLEKAGAESDLRIQDVIGLNYYFHNQWRHPSRRKIPRGHKQYRPLNEILIEFHKRYDRPILIAETGIEDDQRAAWFRYVCDEAAVALCTRS